MLRNNLHCDGFLCIDLGSKLASKFTFFRSVPGARTTFDRQLVPGFGIFGVVQS